MSCRRLVDAQPSERRPRIRRRLYRLVWCAGLAAACSLLVLGVLSSALSVGSAEPASASARWAAEMAAAAQAWLEQGGAGTGAQRPFAEAERGNWHYVPRRRMGLALGRMQTPLRERALALLRTGLSEAGAVQAEAVMALESILAELEGSSLRFRDPLGYALTIFGTPGTCPWGWRLEGHHLSLNVTIATPERIAMTPLFVGTNPARIPRGPRAGERLQRVEHDLALELARSLDAEQFGAALLDARTPGDVITGPGRAASIARPQGLGHAALKPAQQAQLWQLIQAYVGRAHDAFGRPYLEIVREGLSQTRLAWAGGRQAGTAFYYRIHGPRLLIEFDNTQNRANHIHSLWRDPANDFGRDDLHEHYGSHAHGDHSGR